MPEQGRYVIGGPRPCPACGGKHDREDPMRPAYWTPRNEVICARCGGWGIVGPGGENLTRAARAALGGAVSEEKRDLWWEFLHPEKQLCGLCGNTGWIDTRGRAVSPAGVECGVRAPCICPNGRSIKDHGEVVGVLRRIED